MGARSWSSAAQPSSDSSSSSSSSAAATTTAGPLFSSSSSSSTSSLSSSPSCSPPPSSSPSPTGGKKHRHRLQQQQPTGVGGCSKRLLPTERHAFFRVTEGKDKPVEATGASPTTAKAAAVAAQRAERNISVRRDLALDLPPSLALPDGEERPYGSSIRLRIRDYDQESEIYRECIRPPPNRTVPPTTFPPFRCNSESILTHPSTTHTAGRNIKSNAAVTNSSPSSILTVCCASSSSTSLSSSTGYGYQNMSHHHSPAMTARPADKDSFSSHSNRLLLDIHGQPIVTRSKSMSTGSSLQQQQQQPSTDLMVMVPTCHPPKTLESAVKSYVRSLRDRVQKPSTATTGVDNVAYETSRRPSHQTEPVATAGPVHQEPSSSRSRKLANLPVVSCASATAPIQRPPDET